jgi:FlaA1/EpsC-like NDP-sugar epimerase
MFGRIGDFLSSLPRSLKLAIHLLVDATALSAVVWLGYRLQLRAAVRPAAAELGLMALAPIVALPVFWVTGLYRGVIRYLPERIIWKILLAMALATLAWAVLLFIARALRVAELPMSLPFFYFAFGAIVIGGWRFAAKLLLFSGGLRSRPGARLLIHGAGDAGQQLATALGTHGAAPVAGFLDDDRELQGREVAGLGVYSPDEAEQVIRALDIGEVIAVPPLEGVRRRELADRLAGLGVKLRTLPAIGDIAAGKYLVSRPGEVDLDALLGRSSVPADPELLKPMIAARSIMVTGAGGSIGSELCRIVSAWGPGKLVLLEANEFALYRIERQLTGMAGVPLVPVLGSVTDAALVSRTIAANGVEAIFHAAAHKHVPLVEANPLEGVRNNVFGTVAVVEAALAGGVRDFVLISTDKAVRPSNVMGATKRWAELVVRAAGDRAAATGSGQRFSAVRFGNVLSSNGSVVPLFREQIAAGGPVTLTDERMTRYFMSIHEAAELIVQAATMNEAGELFLLDMGEPVKIRDLAVSMTRLAGLTVRSPERPDGDIEIVVTGARPGEKLSEELFYDPAQAMPTRHPKILRAHMGRPLNGTLEAALAELRRALDCADEAALRRVLFSFIAS